MTQQGAWAVLALLVVSAARADEPKPKPLDLRGMVVPARRAFATPAAPGRVGELLVKEGQKVKKGEVVARLNRSGGGAENVPSPIDGVVLAVTVEVGVYSDPSRFGLVRSASICEVADLSVPEVELAVPASDLSRVAVGQACQVTVDLPRPAEFKGIVDRISPVIDRSQRTVPVWVRFRGPTDGVIPVHALAAVRFPAKE